MCINKYVSLIQTIPTTVQVCITSTNAHLDKQLELQCNVDANAANVNNNYVLLSFHRNALGIAKLD